MAARRLARLAALLAASLAGTIGLALAINRPALGWLAAAGGALLVAGAVWLALHTFNPPGDQ